MKRLLSITLLLLAACQNAPEAPRYPMPRFDDLPKIPVQASEIQVVRNYIPTGLPPQVEHEFPVRIDDVAEQWIRDRVQLVGPSGTLTFVIEDARVTRADLPRTKGIKGAFTTDQAERYDARLQVNGTLEQYAPNRRNATTTAEVRITRSLEENASIRQHEELYYSMMQEIVSRFGNTMEKQMREQMAPYDSAGSWR